MRCVRRVQVHRQRRHRGDAAHVGGAARPVPQRDERRRARSDEVDRARQQRIVHHGRPAEIDPAHGDVLDAGCARVLLDERRARASRATAGSRRRRRRAEFEPRVLEPPPHAASATAPSVASTASRSERETERASSMLACVSAACVPERSGAAAARGHRCARELAGVGELVDPPALLDDGVDLTACGSASTAWSTNFSVICSLLSGRCRLPSDCSTNFVSFLPLLQVDLDVHLVLGDRRVADRRRHGAHVLQEQDPRRLRR